MCHSLLRMDALRNTCKTPFPRYIHLADTSSQAPTTTCKHPRRPKNRRPSPGDVGRMREATRRARELRHRMRSLVHGAPKSVRPRLSELRREVATTLKDWRNAGTSASPEDVLERVEHLFERAVALSSGVPETETRFLSARRRAKALKKKPERFEKEPKLKPERVEDDDGDRMTGNFGAKTFDSPLPADPRMEKMPPNPPEPTGDFRTRHGIPSRRSPNEVERALMEEGCGELVNK